MRRLIERAVAPPGSWSTLTELVAPLHDYTESHGISEKEVEQLFGEQIADRRMLAQYPRAKNLGS